MIAMRRVLFTTLVSLLLFGIQAIAQDLQHRDTLDVAKVSADRWAPSKLTDTGFMRLESVEMKKGMALLQELSKTYQILYFTCHSSRA